MLHTGGSKFEESPREKTDPTSYLLLLSPRRGNPFFYLLVLRSPESSYLYLKNNPKNLVGRKIEVTITGEIKLVDQKLVLRIS